MFDVLRSERLVAIVRAPSADGAERAVHALWEGGIKLVEVSLTTPGAISLLSRLMVDMPAGALLGAGTVITERDVMAVEQAGVDFIVTPAVTDGLDAAVELDLPVIAGALTPTEIVEAVSRGASAIKLFPASLGGPSYLKALRDPFPGIPFIPVGGVDLTLAREFWSLGAPAVGVGSPLIGDAARGGDLEQLAARIAFWRRAIEDL